MEGIGGRWSSSASGSVASNGKLGLALERSEKRAAPPPPLIRAATDDAIVNSGVVRVLRGKAERTLHHTGPATALWSRNVKASGGSFITIHRNDLGGR